MERIGCGGIGWTGVRGSGAAVEGHSVAESKSRLERGSNGEVEIRDDRVADRK